MSSTQPVKKSYKETFTFEQRKKVVKTINEKFPGKLPVICEKSQKSKDVNIPDIEKTKYLIPCGLTVAQFVYTIRKGLTLLPEQAIFIFVDNTLPASYRTMQEIYDEFKDEDGLLYTVYSGENTFGV
jgi:GABA(A) receptor-associated protein